VCLQDLQARLLTLTAEAEALRLQKAAVEKDEGELLLLLPRSLQPTLQQYPSTYSANSSMLHERHHGECCYSNPPTHPPTHLTRPCSCRPPPPPSPRASAVQQGGHPQAVAGQSHRG
jgi:hypothetical protein